MTPAEIDAARRICDGVTDGWVQPDEFEEFARDALPNALDHIAALTAKLAAADTIVALCEKAASDYANTNTRHDRGCSHSPDPFLDVIEACETFRSLPR